MSSKLGQALSRLLPGTSLVGDGFLVRIRSVSIALLSLVTALGLGLIVFISQLGWPAVFSAPIPGNPPERGVVHNATIALASSQRAGSTGRTQAKKTFAAPGRHGGRQGGGPRTSSDSGLGESRQIAAAPTSQPGPTKPIEPSQPSPPSAAPPSPSQPSPVTTATAPTPPPNSESTSVPAPEAPAAVEPGAQEQEKDDNGGYKGFGDKGRGQRDDQPTEAEFSPEKSDQYSSGSAGKQKGYKPEKHWHYDSPAPSQPSPPAPVTSPPPSPTSSQPKEWSDQSDDGEEFGDYGGHYGKWGRGGHY